MLAPFVRDLKKDMYQECEYLKFLHISTKYVRPCKCSDFNVHSYCMTAKIIKNQRIYCDSCQQFFKLFIKQENICTGKFVQTLAKYLCLFIILIFFTALFLVLDSYLKSTQNTSTTQPRSNSTNSTAGNATVSTGS